MWRPSSIDSLLPEKTNVGPFVGGYCSSRSIATSLQSFNFLLIVSISPGYAPTYAYVGAFAGSDGKDTGCCCIIGSHESLALCVQSFPRPRVR